MLSVVSGMLSVNVMINISTLLPGELKGVCSTSEILEILYKEILGNNDWEHKNDFNWYAVMLEQEVGRMNF